MNIYMVGGAVRDRLLGLPVKDRDWVVVGATVAQMLEQKYVQVGRDFPVFYTHTAKKNMPSPAQNEKAARVIPVLWYTPSPMSHLNKTCNAAI